MGQAENEKVLAIKDIDLSGNNRLTVKEQVFTVEGRVRKPITGGIL